ncbi:MAG: response regulator [Candidatus Aminicenantaceae bacterium]
MKEKKVLIADYDQRSLDSLVKMFKPYDIQILTARDGETAFDIVQKENPDLVICEAMLPKIHGFDLTKKINMNNKNPVPVIIITNVYKGSHYRDEAIRFLGLMDILKSRLMRKNY